MRHKSLADMQCPIARSLERIGEWWSILILADAFRGLARFDQFRESLGISPNILTRRLNSLVAAGLLERRRYSERPRRGEYVLSQSGRDFRAVTVGIARLGQQAFRPRRQERRDRRQPDRGGGRTGAGRPQEWPPAHPS